ncbi:MAG: MBOAT family O-acyltransferase [Bacteroidota bacterium]
MCWIPELIIVIVASTLVNYTFAISISKQTTQSRKKLLLISTLILNLGTLIVFKYLGVVREIIHSLYSTNNPGNLSSAFFLIAPIGISYYTLQSLSYILDVYYGKRKAERHPGIFALYVAFFPLILSGPIERSTHLLPQFREKERIKLNSTNIEEGIKLIIFGYFLKLVIADRTSIYVDAVFGNIQRHGGITFIVTIILYSFQIYSDFAGYSAIAIGSARLMGFDVYQNFNRPYFSSTIREFWTRWHISLSIWLRDYLFNPLTFYFMRVFRKECYLKIISPELLTYAFSAFITFVICGLWHGARFTFLIWGSLHGIYLIIERATKRKSDKTILNIIITYIMILFTWIFFRSDNVNDAFLIIRTIFTHPGSLYIPFDNDVVAPVYAILGILILVVMEVKKEFFNQKFSLTNNKNEYVRMISFGLMIFLILYLGVFDASQFMYFKF